MVEFKLVISNPKTGKSMQRELKEPEARSLVGMKLGEVIKGEAIKLAGYEFKITGGSDYCGFPMRKDVIGTERKRILAVSGVGLRKKDKGIKQRKTVCGNTIHARIAQINLAVMKEGKENLFESAKEESKEEKPKEKKVGKKEAAKKEEKK